MNKVFYRCIEQFDSGRVMFKVGEEITPIELPIRYRDKFQRIERETFEHGGEVWFRHTPGDPMPCSGDKKIDLLTSEGSVFDCERADYFFWRMKGFIGIGWRYAREPEAKPVGDGATDDAKAIQNIVERPSHMINRDLAAIEDSSLTPAQRRHWEQMEAKQAAKEQLKHDAEAKAMQERAKQLSDAGNAMDRVNQDHGHKLGAMQCTHHGK